MVKISIDFEKKHIFLITAVAVFLAGIIVAIATTPDPGHDISQISAPSNCNPGDVLSVVSPSGTIECKNTAKWTDLNMQESLGNLPENTTLFYYNLPALPSNAKEVLVYVSFRKRTNYPLSSDVYYTLYTKESGNGGASYYQRFFAQTPQGSSYPGQPASENLWLPLTSERKIYAQLETVPNQNLTKDSYEGYIYLRGYR